MKKFQLDFLQTVTGHMIWTAKPHWKETLELPKESWWWASFCTAEAELSRLHKDPARKRQWDEPSENLHLQGNGLQ